MDKWNFLVIPNGNDRTTNPAHKLFARQRHSVAANTPVESQFRRCRRHFRLSRHCPLTWAWKREVSMRILVIVALALCVFSSQAQAGCTCQCVDGKMQPLCSSTLDIAPPCMGICGPVAPSIAPINPPRISPLGTTSCRQAQICDQFGNCRWQQVCR